MPEPLTIYECTGCGEQRRHERDWCCYEAIPRSTRRLAREVVPVRMFREADVRPLWEAARVLEAECGVSAPDWDAADEAAAAIDAFPAPDDWKDTDRGDEGGEGDRG